MKIYKLSMLERLPLILKTPKYEYRESLQNSIFSISKPKFPNYVAVPMLSGKIGLLKFLGLDTPWDPGDLHFPMWGFVKYLKS